MNFTAGEWMALIAGAGVVIVNIISALRSTTRHGETKATLAKLTDDAVAIKTSVDGASHRADARIESLEHEIKMLLADKAEQKQTAAVLAQTHKIVSKELNGPVVDESTVTKEEAVKKPEQDNG